MRKRATIFVLLLAVACSRSNSQSPASTPSPRGPAEPKPKGTPQLMIVGSNVIVPVKSTSGGLAEVMTPCEQTQMLDIASGESLTQASVVLDPGHGGDERGAIGPGGLEEKEVNLHVARLAADELGQQGISSVLSRTGDYRATLNFRTAVAEAVRPVALVSIHHNSDPDGRRDRPGTESYFQYKSAASKRLAGLLYEETFTAIRQFNADWVGDTDAGAKWRLDSEGDDDYYAMLRGPARSQITASLLELAFISNPQEESLLRRDDFRQAEAQAVARAVVRFIRTEDAGSGFTQPYTRSQPAGLGGGRAGCVDPSLN